MKRTIGVALMLALAVAAQGDVFTNRATGETLTGRYVGTATVDGAQVWVVAVGHDLRRLPVDAWTAKLDPKGERPKASAKRSPVAPVRRQVEAPGRTWRVGLAHARVYIADKPVGMPGFVGVLRLEKIGTAEQIEGPGDLGRQMARDLEWLGGKLPGGLPGAP
jgi:hypothetical protein